MKKILITGANSFIGISFETYLRERFAGEYVVDTVDMIDGSWREKDFSGYDSVFHVAGIAHRNTGTVNAEAFRDCVNTVLSAHQSAAVTSDEDLMALRNKLKERKGTNG